MEDLKLGLTSAKCAAFASTFLMLLVGSQEGFWLAFIPLWFVGFVVLFVISILMILLTIVLIYQIVEPKSKTHFFKTYFPYYAILCFISCLGLWQEANFNIEILAILVTAFLTAMCSWVWLFKTKETNHE